MLLIDENLSWRMVRDLEPHFPGCMHVNSTELSVPTKDVEIWKYANKQGLIILTIDEDFMHLLMQLGFPPKIILLKFGNQLREAIVRTVIAHRNEILELQDSKVTGALEIHRITPSPSNQSKS